ncbi:hypothetical protein SNE40_001416 [Patella caerulea]|uniref:Uncharacterized protein n=1 Tax=Patella caerulea TaxID=87958 RepID=A0AAN8KFW7_PATCE
MFALAGWTGSILVSTFNARVCMMLSGLVTLIGFVLNSLVVNMKYLFITHSLIAGDLPSIIKLKQNRTNKTVETFDVDRSYRYRNDGHSVLNTVESLIDT